MLRLRRTINKLELAIKSSEYFYSHQFMKFHGQIQKIHTHTHKIYTWCKTNMARMEPSLGHKWY